LKLSRIIFLSVLVSITTTLACSSIKIETGSTAETDTEMAEVTAREIRTDWFVQLEGAEPLEMAEMLRVHVDSTTAVLIRYGFTASDHWYDGNKQRGEDIPAEEMRETIDAWISTQRPILEAYDDNIEYALDRIRDFHFFDQQMIEQILSIADLYDQAYSVVFLPVGDVRSYENRLYDTRAELERKSKEFATLLRRY